MKPINEVEVDPREVIEALAQTIVEQVKDNAILQAKCLTLLRENEELKAKLRENEELQAKLETKNAMA